MEVARALDIRRSGDTPGEHAERIFTAREPRSACAEDRSRWTSLVGAPPLPTTSLKRTARGLAAALVAGRWSLEEIVARGAQALGRRPRWLRPLAKRLLAAFGGPSRPRAARVAEFLSNDERFRVAWRRRPFGLGVSPGEPPAMAPAEGAPASWGLPSLTTPAALASWLELSVPELEWFADAQGRLRTTTAGPLCHYDYRWRPRRPGPARLIESPRPRLKALQRRLLDGLLARIPPHEAAHGFREGRSVRTFAAPHVGKAVVVKLDLRDFFATVTAERVSAIYRTAGYPEPVATLLAGLCTNRVPSAVRNDPAAGLGNGPEAWRRRRLFAEPHLPQGGPTSSALANLAAHRLDCRLAALAASMGASYTRYADDLALSDGPELARSARRLPALVGAIALEEGFAVQPRKTRLMRRSDRQRLAGVVVNERLNVSRADYDALKALLHNCLKTGPAAQNRPGHADFRAHLTGRVAHVASLHPDRGQKLRAMLERIAW
jgi:hypothetical protein